VADHPSSLETHASILTGLTPPQHGAHRPFLSEGVDNPLYAHPLDERHTTLAELLQPAGYWSVGLSGNAGPLSPEFGLAQGFDVYRATAEDVRRRTPWHVPLEFLTASQASVAARLLPSSWTAFVSTKPYREAAVITDEAVSVLDAAGDRSLFLFLNYFDAHAPNTPPGPFLDAFPGRMRDSDLDGSYQSTRDYYGMRRRALTGAEQTHLQALYDGEVAYLDSELARLLERLRKHPRWNEMLVIVTSDHGESLGEHGLLGHGHSLYEQQIAVPFLVKPGLVPAPVAVPGVLTQPVLQSTDAFALVLRQSGVQVPPGQHAPLWGEGRTVTRAWSYCARDHSRWDRVRFEQELRLVEVGPLKLIASSRGTFELYDFVADPEERHDLQSERPEALARLEALLEPFDLPGRSSRGEATNEDLKERLRSLGYVQ
jgi:arylsulfatase A-like enzyme